MSQPYKRNFESELQFTTSRSSGPGGQNVNKVETRVTLRFNIGQSELLSEEEKVRLRDKISNKITTNDDLLISSESERSQLKNKEEVKKKFYSYLKEAFKEKKKRRATKPTKASQKKRMEKKKQHSEKKKMRQKLL